MKGRTLAYTIGIVTLCATASATKMCAQQSEHNRIITFDAPGSGTNPGTLNCFGSCPGTVAENANREGAVTGYFVDANNIYHGFVRDAWGKITVLDAPHAGTASGQGTVAYSINSEGAIAGQYENSNNVYYGFLRSPHGEYTEFQIPGLDAGANQGAAGAANINDAGEIAGYFVDENNVYHGFVRYADGRIETFDAPHASKEANSPPQGTVVALESGLNNEGAVTGWYFDSNLAVHGYVRWPDGHFTEFDNSLGGSAAYQGTYPGSINSEGAVTGGAMDANYVVHGFVRDRDGDMITFEAPGSGDTAGTEQGTFGVGINDAGEVTAYYTDANNLTHGSLRYGDGRIETFNVLQAGTGAGQGTTPQGINAAGVVPGYYTDSNNVNHGFLRLP